MVENWWPGMLGCMSSSKPSNQSILEAQDGRIVVRIVNRVMDSVDAADFSTEEALLINIVLVNAMGALWQEHGEALGVLYTRMFMMNDTEEDDTEPEDGSDDDTTH